MVHAIMWPTSMANMTAWPKGGAGPTPRALAGACQMQRSVRALKSARNTPALMVAKPIEGPVIMKALHTASRGGGSTSSAGITSSPRL